MNNQVTCTRFAPSPTGFMHIGNLRTALFAYLLAKSQNGRFILRIEDTDQVREVPGAVDVILKTLEMTGIKYDEGPVVGGEHGPYIQSQRKQIHQEYAKKLVEMGRAYYCFCTKERLAEIHDSCGGYDLHCRDYNGPSNPDHPCQNAREHGILSRQRKERIPWHTDSTQRSTRRRSFWRFSKGRKSWARLRRRTT